MQKFDDFLDKYLNEQNETFRSEYKKAKEDLEDLLENSLSLAKRQTQKHTLSQQRQRKDVKTRITH